MGLLISATGGVAQSRLLCFWHLANTWKPYTESWDAGWCPRGWSVFFPLEL